MSSLQKEKEQSTSNKTEVQLPFDKIDLSIFKDHIEHNFLEKLSLPHMQDIEKVFTQNESMQNDCELDVRII